MRRWAVVLSAVTISLGAATTVAGTAVADPPDNDPYTLSNGHAQSANGIVPARDANGQSHGHGPGGGGGGSSPNLVWGGGPVQHGTYVKALFWGSSWANNTFVGDKITGLDSFYGGLTNSTPSPYAATNTEYTDGSGHVSPVVSYAGHNVDTSALTFSGAPSTTTIANYVLSTIGAKNLQPGGYYPVYVDAPRGNAGYCAWHSAATVRSTGVEFQFGFFFNLDGDGGCDPQDTSGQHSQGLAALANVSGHEFSEMVTDPQLNAWRDQQGQENADKCAWSFNGLETLSNNTQWLIQGNWSNAAYTAGHGYNSGGKVWRGCMNGYTTTNSF